MAAYDYSPVQDSTAVFAGRVGKAIAAAIAAVSDWNDDRLTRKALSKLTKHELDDIGLSGVSLETVMRKGRL